MSLFYDRKVSSTYLKQVRSLMSLAKIFDSLCDINRLPKIGDTGDLNATPFFCLHNVPLKINRVEFQ